MTSRSYIYTRVSTPEQNTLSQLQEFPADVLAAIPEQRRVAEVVSGKVPACERLGFSQLLLKLERGDSLYVAKLDRLGRNTADVLATVELLTKEGSNFTASIWAVQTSLARQVSLC